jgi:hypothetical protein
MPIQYQHPKRSAADATASESVAVVAQGAAISVQAGGSTTIAGDDQSITLTETTTHSVTSTRTAAETLTPSTEEAAISTQATSQPPSADLTHTVQSGTTVDFDASGTTDPDSTDSNLEYRYDFQGNGTYDTSWQVDNTSETHTYSSSGSYVANVQVRDPDGNTDIASTSVQV